MHICTVIKMKISVFINRMKQVCLQIRHNHDGDGAHLRSFGIVLDRIRSKKTAITKSYCGLSIEKRHGLQVGTSAIVRRHCLKLHVRAILKTCLFIIR